MKFNKGDTVRCVTEVYKNETVGKEYLVIRGDHLESWTADPWFTVRSDDDGNSNSYKVKDFELVKPATLKEPLRVGDRVRVYSFTGAAKGIVAESSENGTEGTPGNILVRFDSPFDLGYYTMATYVWASPKQCRRLKRKTT